MCIDILVASSTRGRAGDLARNSLLCRDLRLSERFGRTAENPYLGHVRKVGPEDGPKTLPALERHTISWLPTEFPRTLRMSLVASPGRNYSLPETLHLAARQGLPVRHWGPYEIDESLYVRALSQIAFLNSGRVRYKLVEPIRRRRALLRTGGALHCTHAVTDLHGFVVTGFTRGYAAGGLAAALFADDLRGPAPTWLFGRIVNGDESDDFRRHRIETGMGTSD